MKKIREYIFTLKTNIELRILLSSSISFIINVAFLVYNLVIGIMYQTVWNCSISFYYALLVLSRAIILFNERRWRNLDVDLLKLNRFKLYKHICRLLIVLDLALVAPITLMVLSHRAVDVGMIPTLAIASYTTYKVTIAIINYSRKKFKQNLAVKALRLITLKDAIVSVLTMQNTMVTVFGDGNTMLSLTAVSSGIALICLVIITLYSINNAKKYFND